MTAKTVLNNLLILQKAFGVGSVKAYNYYLLLRDKALLSHDIFSQKSLFDEKDFIKILAVDKNYTERLLDLCVKNDIKIITPCDTDFPDRLININPTPLVLFYKGTFPHFDDEPTICIVGPRKVSQFGGKAAYSLSYRLARAGFTIVSGAAVGCDTFAHKGAIKAGGTTVAVLGCGILSDYLPEQRCLRNEIAEKGCLISEIPPAEKGSKFSFPIRNRILSGLSLGVAVIEAAEKSGAINTAHHAAAQGRDVFVIPGNPVDEHYKGSNNLLRDGAKPLIDASDIFNEYIVQYADKIDIEKAFAKSEEISGNKKFTKKIVKGLSKSAEILYNSLDNQKFTADNLMNCNLSYDEILSSLTELEIAGYIKSLPGGIYVTI